MDGDRCARLRRLRPRTTPLSPCDVVVTLCIGIDSEVRWARQQHMGSGVRCAARRRRCWPVLAFTPRPPPPPSPPPTAPHRLVCYTTRVLSFRLAVPREAAREKPWRAILLRLTQFARALGPPVARWALHRSFAADLVVVADTMGGLKLQVRPCCCRARAGRAASGGWPCWTARHRAVVSPRASIAAPPRGQHPGRRQAPRVAGPLRDQ